MASFNFYIESLDSTKGTVTLGEMECGNYYINGDTISNDNNETSQAIPATGYMFDHWNDEDTPVSDGSYFGDGSWTMYAVFVEKPRDVRIGRTNAQMKSGGLGMAIYGPGEVTRDVLTGIPDGAVWCLTFDPSANLSICIWGAGKLSTSSSPTYCSGTYGTYPIIRCYLTNTSDNGVSIVYITAAKTSSTYKITASSMNKCILHVIG